MLTQLAISLLAQAPEPSLPGWMWAFVAGGVAAAAAFAWAFTQLRGSQRRLAQLTVEHESTTTAHRELLERERKQAKTLDEKRNEIIDLKRDLATQKKKNHTTQEEAKSLRNDLRDLQSELAEARKQKRPAFADKPEPAPTPEKNTAAKPEPAPTPTPEENKAPPPVDDHRVTELEAELRSKQEALHKDRTALKEARSELKSLRRRVEGLRRIDLITTGKIEVLEDKVHALGRQFYDAVSELAALKGEVKPPPPRELASEKSRNKKRDEIDEMASSGAGSSEKQLRATNSEPKERTEGEPVMRGAQPAEDEPADQAEGDQAEGDQAAELPRDSAVDKAAEKNVEQTA